MKILVTGSSGLVGSALVEELKRVGNTVVRLVRPGTAGTLRATEGFDVEWNPETGALGGAAVGADAVVNLAGASIAEGRWSDERKVILRASRVACHQCIGECIGADGNSPASAGVGIGHRVLRKSWGGAIDRREWPGQ